MGMHLEEEYAKCSHCQFVDESTLDLNLCKELKYDLNNTFVLFPKDLKLAHDMATEHFNRKKEQKKKREFNKQKKSYLALKNNYIDKFLYEY